MSVKKKRKSRKIDIGSHVVFCPNYNMWTIHERGRKGVVDNKILSSLSAVRFSDANYVETICDASLRLEDDCRHCPHRLCHLIGAYCPPDVDMDEIRKAVREGKKSNNK